MYLNEMGFGMTTCIYSNTFVFFSKISFCTGKMDNNTGCHKRILRLPTCKSNCLRHKCQSYC
jgi:hypothetical protein